MAGRANFNFLLLYLYTRSYVGEHTEILAPKSDVLIKILIFHLFAIFFCLYGGSEIEEGRIRHIFLRVYSAAPEIREMA